jgi:hypothetical protein
VIFCVGKRPPHPTTVTTPIWVATTSSATPTVLASEPVAQLQALGDQVILEHLAV